MNKVLIIDDDKELCALMKKCIEQEKLSAVTVYNGIEGVRLIDENKDSYSLIILDVMLPDIDGFQILQKIRDKSNIPVLMLTAKSSEEDKVFGLRLGADDYLFFDEQKNDTLKGLLIIPISKTQLYFSKIAVVIFMSLALCLLTFAICILGGFLAGGFTDLNTETILQAGLLFLAGGVLVPLAMLPVIFLATLAKGYVLPIGAALLYLVPVVLIPSGIMGLHPLASVMGIYPYISSDAAEMVKKWAGGIEITISPNICLISLLVIGSISAIVSVLALRKQTY